LKERQDYPTLLPRKSSKGTGERRGNRGPLFSSMVGDLKE